MGLLKMIASAFSKRILVEETIRTQEKIYEREKRRHPELEPHNLLARVFASRLATRGMDIADPDVQEMAYAVTFLFSCLPYPDCIKVLALYIMRDDFPHAILAANPEIVDECNALMEPLNEACRETDDPWDADLIRQLYARYNPRSAAEMGIG